MSAPGLTTPLRKETFENLQLNAGIFLKNFTYDSIADAGALKTAIKSQITAGTSILGATRGGGTFTVTREMRDPEADGKRYRYKKGTFVDSVDAKLATTLIEITPANIVAAIGGEAETSGKKTVIKMPTALSDAAYLDNIVWVGDLADGRLVMIVLKNAINVSDLTLTFTDKGEGTLPVEFHATQDKVDDYDYAPYEIVYFDQAA